MEPTIKDPLKADLEQVLEAPAYTEVRWALCLAVDKFGETGCHLEDLWLVADSMHCGLGRKEVNQMILALVGGGWVEYHEGNPQDYVTPTEKLGQLCRYEIEAPADIGRPSEKYWEG